MKVRKKRCKECKELFTPKYSTTQIACSPSCAYAYSKRRQAEIKEQNSVSLTKAFEEKKNRKSLSSEIQKTQTLVNKYVRLRDYGKPCISQNIPYKKDFDAGHLYSKNTYSAIRFHLDNIHGQSIYANRYLEGDFDNYLLNLPSRIGKEKVVALESLAMECKKTTKKWTFEELEEIQRDIKLKIKQL